MHLLCLNLQKAISCHLTILPNKDGRKVLAEIKADEDLRHIPVVMGTVSSAEEDILKTYNLHANCYITKPIDLDQSIKAARSMSARS